ncbi:MAG: SPOR domain-containing protein [Lutibacter sp.]
MKIYAIPFNILLFISLLYAGNTIHAQSESVQIKQLINQKRAFNKSNKVSSVYRIQLFNGDEKTAYQTKANFLRLFPEYKVKIVYNAPEWKTQVGYFLTRLEADRALNKIQLKFSGSFVLKDKI